MVREFVRISVVAAIVVLAGSAAAQPPTAITTTSGPGNLGTVVTPAGNTFNITGGTRPGNGPNLFHSFGLFNVGPGDIVKFQNTTPGTPTANILGRITGGQVSTI